MQEINFYQPHLDRVSRSFAFCIARLEGEMREWVSLSYLLCRILDTVEDAIWPTASAQDEAFETFARFLEQAPTSEQAKAWADSFPADIPTSERLLLEDSDRCFRNLQNLPEGVQVKIRGSVLNMYRGMRFFLAERREKGSLRLRTLADVNQYCFFVAGLVGELLTELVRQRHPQLPATSRLFLDAHHFGLFLQKINLLKDQSGDEKEGRYLVPSRKEMLASLAHDAEGAIRYLQAMPVTEKGFRLFCAWSLFLGLASLPWIEKSSILGVLMKIPRLVTEKLLGRVEKVIDDNQALAALFKEMMPSLPLLVPVGRPLAPLPWMEKIYQGALGKEDFRELGMLPIKA
jgi:phytoene/squalene synthetase